MHRIQNAIKSFRLSIYFFPTIIFLITLLLHGWYGSQHVIFSQDQARDLYIVSSAIDDQQLIFGYGPKTSVGNFTVFPFYYQLFVIVQLLFNHPLSMHYAVIILESLTPVFLYLILIQFIRKESALLGAFAYASFFLVLQFSTAAWSPNLLPLFSTVSLWGWLRFLNHSSYKHLLPAIVFLALSIHLHFQSFILIPFAAIAGIFSLKKLVQSWKFLVLGMLLALVSFAPYVAAEIDSNWQNTLTIYQFYTREHAQYFDRVSTIEYVFSFYPALFERIIMGSNTHLLWLGRGIFFIGGALLGFQALTKKRYRWLALYLLCAIITVRMFKGDKHDYYLMPFFIFPAIFISLIFEHVRRWLQILIIIVLLLALGRHYFVSGFNQYSAYLNQASQLEHLLEPFDSVHLILHDLDTSNSLLYFLLTSNQIDLDRNSNTIVDICPTFSDCTYNQETDTHSSPIASYSADIKIQNEILDYHLPTNAGHFFYTIVQVPEERIKVLPPQPSVLLERKDFITQEIN